ncbi:hypothetical protein LC048_20885 [Mesobacillus subterraneus]|uniref:hypothetical protein n=1 Tax=Mesobacillus subterraneus TaxID=285983 RepID=UPI002740135C|nr:hypothetical protein [Mesobacillus subterraneus]WLR54824.1 hypothetical protein LC048_20885 [Mesobacillus subterraneus]
MKGMLERARESGDTYEMIYQSNDGVLSQRKVKILSVNELTIKAYCYLKQQPRIFSLANILSIEPVRPSRKGA